MDEAQARVLQAYLAVSQTRDGALVLDDLRSAFVRREQDEALADDLEPYPHPYRAYVEIGMRLVVQKIEAAIAAAELARLRQITPEDAEEDEPHATDL